MKPIKIDALQNVNSGDKKLWDLQYLDTWVNIIQIFLNMEVITLESKEGWQFIGFKLQSSVLSTFNHYLSNEKD